MLYLYYYNKFFSGIGQDHKIAVNTRKTSSKKFFLDNGKRKVDL